MIKPLIAAAFAALMSVFVGIGAANAAATAEPLDIDPELLSKLAKERAKNNTVAKRSAPASRSGNGPDQNEADCGAVAIGNVNTGGRIGFQPQEVTVIITGDVINANNRCR